MSIDLLAQIRKRASSPEGPTDEALGGGKVWPPIHDEAVARVEAAMGYQLPPLLKRLYQEIGNGGFGPDYGLLGLVGGAKNELGEDALTLYLSLRKPNAKDRFWCWPENLLPAVKCGCGMYLCVDCTSNDGKIVWFEPNPHESAKSWADSFIPLNCNLEKLMQAWVRGQSWIDQFSQAD
jgi:hypothetical protein